MLTMDNFLADIRHGVRTLVRMPGFAIITILTLALGIGANTAIFTVVNAVILRPLGYPRPDRLIYISSQFPQLGFDQFWVSPPEYFELKERTRSFSSIGAFSTGNVNLSGGDRPRRVESAVVSASLFQAARRIADRSAGLSMNDETLPKGPAVAVCRQRALAIGSSAGVATSSAARWRLTASSGPSSASCRRISTSPTTTSRSGCRSALDPANRQNRGSHFLYLIGRLADGATLAQRARRARDAARRAGAASTGIAKPAPNQRVHTPNAQKHRLRYDALQAQIVGGARTRGVGAAGRGRLRAAHRLREPREPAAGARGVAAQGVRRARGARRRPLAAAAPVHDGRTACCRSAAPRSASASPSPACARCWRPIPTAFRGRPT